MTKKTDSSYRIKKAAVLGAGTMGAGIAAVFAGAGIPTFLLDILPKAPTEDESKKELTLSSPEVRNRIVRAGLDRALKAKPALFYSPQDAELITLGNVEDNLDYLTEADWIVEAVFERLDVKRDTFAKIEQHRKPGSIVSSNTSGIPLKAIVKDLSLEFRRHALITHFFSPVRYMRILEVVPGPVTKPEVVDFIRDFSERVLGKLVVKAKDSPNFISNRLGVFGIMYLIKVMLEEDYKVEEIDRIFGPAIGRPKSAVFRTVDIAGLDVMADVVKNMYESLPRDEMRHLYQLPEFMQKMVQQKMWGHKTGRGFYKSETIDGKREFLVIDPLTLTYRKQQKFDYESLVKAEQQADMRERLKCVVFADDRAGRLVWKVLSETLLYAARRLPEIADDIYSVDNAMKGGFNWSLGPFEIWDALGVKQVAKRLEREGREIPDLVKKVLQKGNSFYKKRGQQKYYFDLQRSTYRELPRPAGVLKLAEIKENKKKIVLDNASASLLDLGDGVACLEFHSYMNTIDNNTLEMMNAALQRVDRDFVGLVIANEGENFSAGANLMLLLGAMQSRDWASLDRVVKVFQDANMALKYSAKPVVAAPFNMALAGGAEVVLHCARVQAHAELYMGLVEFGVGLIPAGGGCKELWLRAVQSLLSDVDLDLLPLLQRVFETIGLAKVSMSAKEARQLGYLRPSDRITMNRDRLIADAKVQVLAMAAAGYVPPSEPKIRVTGPSGYAALLIGIKNLQWGSRITEHEALMAQNLARVLTGGTTAREITEQRMLDLEREAFLSLCGTEKTQQRIQHFLMKGKPLRN